MRQASYFESIFSHIRFNFTAHMKWWLVTKNQFVSKILLLHYLLDNQTKFEANYVNPNVALIELHR